MFKDETLETISVKSDILGEKFVRDQSCQTRPVKYEEKASQAAHSVTIGSQTESLQEPNQQMTRMRIDTSKNLSNFVLNVYPMVSEQLLANIRSHAFDDYVLHDDDGNKVNEPKCVHSLNCDNKTIDGLSVTALSWNSIGSVIAVSFGMFDHYSWCTHQASIYLWSVDRKDITNESPPDRIIDADACVTAMMFNPQQPALLVGGTFSGGINIWDLSKDDNLLVAMTGKDIVSHHELVNEIIWLSSSAVHNHQFISVGSDGNIFTWSFNQLRQELSLTKKYCLLSDVIPRSLRTNILKKNVAVGITCITVNPHNNNIIYIGTENGGVFKYIDNASKGNVDVSNETKDFNIQAFEGHEATVNAIDASPHDEEMFMTCASDMSVHIYNSTQMKPLHKTDPLCGYLLDVKWSLTMPTVCYIATSSGKLLVYEVQENEVTLSYLVQICGEKYSVDKIAFNNNRLKTLATSDSTGTLKIWQLPG